MCTNKIQIAAAAAAVMLNIVFVAQCIDSKQGREDASCGLDCSSQ